MDTTNTTAAKIRRIIGSPSTAYDTHRPVLAEAIIRTSGAILELGMGEGSTPGLDAICRLTSRVVYSFEDDMKFYVNFNYSTPNHHLVLVSDWDDAYIDAPWSVALVDHGQMHRRVREIARLAANTEIVVVHDTEDWRYNYWSIYGLFKYRYDYMKVRPWTTAFSNTIDVSEWNVG